eukprot:4817165-Lingulodinium_polyedra.AAC.1
MCKRGSSFSFLRNPNPLLDSNDRTCPKLLAPGANLRRQLAITGAWSASQGAPPRDYPGIC